MCENHDVVVDYSSNYVLIAC